ncbi:MAG: PEP-CTERM sorting domain-containing protein [Akkermansia sp.]
MKKTLILATILFAFYPLAHAGVWRGTYYFNASASDSEYNPADGKYGSIICGDTISSFQAGDATSAVVSSVTLSAGKSLTVSYNSDNSKNLEVTVETLTLSGDGSTLSVSSGGNAFKIESIALADDVDAESTSVKLSTAEGSSMSVESAACGVVLGSMEGSLSLGDGVQNVTIQYDGSLQEEAVTESGFSKGSTAGSVGLFAGTVSGLEGKTLSYVNSSGFTLTATDVNISDTGVTATLSGYTTNYYIVTGDTKNTSDTSGATKIVVQGALHDDAASDTTSTVALELADGSTVTGTGNTKFKTLTFAGNGTYTIQEALRITRAAAFSDANATDIKLNLGATGSITTGGAFQLKKVTDAKHTLTFQATLTDGEFSQLNDALGTGQSLTIAHQLVSATGNYGIWNIENYNLVLGNIVALDELGFSRAESIGISGVTISGMSQEDVITLISGQMACGTYALVSLQGPNESDAGDCIYLAVKVPEPATATLSLLTLAGLAARRRRR